MFDNSSEDRRKDDKRWHLDKRLNIGHMLTTAVIVGSGILMLNNLQDQVISNTAEVAHQRELINRVERLAQARNAEVRTQLDKIDTKIDKLLSREIDRRGR